MVENNIKFVLVGAFSEYASPFWIRYFSKLKGEGVLIGSIVHDPVRDFELGPSWWHRMSIRKVYEQMDFAFVHHDIELDMAGASSVPERIVIPFPSFSFDSAVVETSDGMREALGIPKEAVVFLSFGHIRDSKNIDLVLRAMVDNPKVHLIVAGKEQSSAAKPAVFYEDLSDQLGVKDRLYMINRFIEESELSELFGSADFAILTYSAKFHSGSAALGTCVHFRKRMLVSAAEGPLVVSTRDFGLGVCVEPDSEKAISDGFAKLIDNPSEASWEAFELEYSWERNAKRVLRAFVN